MVVTENIWLDDDTFIVDGKKMKMHELKDLKKEPKRVCMSTNNKELITEIAIARRCGAFSSNERGKKLALLLEEIKHA